MVKHTKVTLSRYSHIAPLDIQNEKDRSVHAAGRKCILGIFCCSVMYAYHALMQMLLCFPAQGP